MAQPATIAHRLSRQDARKAPENGHNWHMSRRRIFLADQGLLAQKRVDSA
jgi:hypothetical protein